MKTSYAAPASSAATETAPAAPERRPVSSVRNRLASWSAYRRWESTWSAKYAGRAWETVEDLDFLTAEGAAVMKDVLRFGDDVQPRELSVSSFGLQMEFRIRTPDHHAGLAALVDHLQDLGYDVEYEFYEKTERGAPLLGYYSPREKRDQKSRTSIEHVTYYGGTRRTRTYPVVSRTVLLLRLNVA